MSKKLVDNLQHQVIHLLTTIIDGRCQPGTYNLEPQAIFKNEPICQHGTLALPRSPTSSDHEVDVPSAFMAVGILQQPAVLNPEWLHFLPYGRHEPLKIDMHQATHAASFNWVNPTASLTLLTTWIVECKIAMEPALNCQMAGQVNAYKTNNLLFPRNWKEFHIVRALGFILCGSLASCGISRWNTAGSAGNCYWLRDLHSPRRPANHYRLSRRNWW